MLHIGILHLCAIFGVSVETGAYFRQSNGSLFMMRLVTKHTNSNVRICMMVLCNSEAQ